MLQIELQQKNGYCIGRFSAMACPCEILLETDDLTLAEKITRLAAEEALRVEHKFSRYRNDNIIYQINNAKGQAITVDNETALLLDFAQQCFELSDGLFDITSGILRRVWRFDGSDRIPDADAVNQLLPFIGWHKISWQVPQIKLPEGMEIDLGGIGKEYAVDATVKLLRQHTQHSFLVNYGGDIACPKPRLNNQPWLIGVDDPGHTGEVSAGAISLYRGGLATSGDARRFLLRDGKRYSHILNPKTGYPVEGAPRSVSVIASTCIEAGMLSTFAMLQGSQAVSFLDAQDVKYWCIA
ncbi:MAG TPA: FAD:protein FMN transferase [Gammaproteobacteria bacterium]